MADKSFPLLQNDPITGVGTIPWSIAELAYKVYTHRYGTCQSLEIIAQRGGFAPKEMDDLLPLWREMF